MVLTFWLRSFCARPASPMFLGRVTRIRTRRPPAVVPAAVEGLEPRALLTVPAFHQATFQFTISEGAQVGEIVGYTGATDTTGGEWHTITYSLASATGGAFAVNATTGAVTVAAPLDFDAVPAHAFDVAASSVNGTGYAHVLVRVDDRPKTDIVGLTGTTRYLGLSTGTAFTTVNTGTATAGLTDVVVGDYNGDGRDDVAGRSSAGQWLVALKTTGSGFTAANPWGTWSTALGGWTHVSALDFNGDGKSDIIGRAGNGSWYLSTSAGTLFNVNQLTQPQPAQAALDARVGDFNGDGADDLAYGDGTGAWTLIRFGAGLVEPWGSWPAASWSHVVAADFDGDGLTDLAGRDSAGNWRVSRWNGTSVVSAVWATLSDSTTWQDVRAGDFDGDGKGDIAGRVGGQWYLAKSDGAAFVSTTWGTWPAGTWADVTAADVDGDGRTDLVGRNTANGQWRVNRWNGTTVVSTVWATWSTSVTWSYVRFGEFSVPSAAAPNYPPVARDDDRSVAEDGTLSVAAAAGLLSNDYDAEGAALAVTEVKVGASAVTLGTGFVIAGKGTLTVNANGSYGFTPVANFNGQVSFTYKATGGQKMSGVATVTITVTPANDAPAGTNKTVTVMEDTEFAFAAADFGFSDPSDDDAHSLLAVKIASLPTAGVISLNGTPVVAGQWVSKDDLDAGRLRYMPAPNAAGTGNAAFTFQVRDGGGTAGGGIDTDPTPNTITIDVSPVDDAPLANADAASGFEDGGAITGGLLGNDAEPDAGSSLAVDEVTFDGQTLPVTTGQPAVFAVAAGTLTVQRNGVFAFVPAANFNGTLSFTYKATDGVLVSAAANVTLTVAAVNDPPVATPDALTAGEDAALIFDAADLLSNDADVDGDQLVVTAVAATSATHGTVFLLDGQITFTPDANYSGPASFTYTISDGNGGTATGVVNVTVDPANDPPEIAAGQSFYLADAAAVGAVVGQVSATDPEGDPLTYEIVAGNDEARFAISADGTITVASIVNPGTLETVVLTVRVSDGAAAAEGFVEVRENRAPLVLGDALLITQGGTASVDVLANDRDPEGTALELVSVSQGDHGTASIILVGGRLEVLYTATDPMFVGQDVLTYTVRDAAGITATGSVLVLVAEAGQGGPPSGGLGGTVPTGPEYVATGGSAGPGTGLSDPPTLIYVERSIDASQRFLPPAGGSASHCEADTIQSTSTWSDGTVTYTASVTYAYQACFEYVVSAAGTWTYEETFSSNFTVVTTASGGPPETATGNYNYVFVASGDADSSTFTYSEHTGVTTTGVTEVGTVDVSWTEQVVRDLTLTNATDTAAGTSSGIRNESGFENLAYVLSGTYAAELPGGALTGTVTGSGFEQTTFAYLSTYNLGADGLWRYSGGGHAASSASESLTYSGTGSYSTSGTAEDGTVTSMSGSASRSGGRTDTSLYSAGLVLGANGSWQVAGGLGLATGTSRDGSNHSGSGTYSRGITGGSVSGSLSESGSSTAAASYTVNAVATPAGWTQTGSAHETNGGGSNVSYQGGGSYSTSRDLDELGAGTVNGTVDEDGDDHSTYNYALDYVLSGLGDWSLSGGGGTAGGGWSRNSSFDESGTYSRSTDGDAGTEAISGSYTADGEDGRSSTFTITSVVQGGALVDTGTATLNENSSGGFSFEASGGSYGRTVTLPNGVAATVAGSFEEDGSSDSQSQGTSQYALATGVWSLVGGSGTFGGGRDYHASYDGGGSYARDFGNPQSPGQPYGTVNGSVVDSRTTDRTETYQGSLAVVVGEWVTTGSGDSTDDAKADITYDGGGSFSMAVQGASFGSSATVTESGGSHLADHTEASYALAGGVWGLSGGTGTSTLGVDGTTTLHGESDYSITLDRGTAIGTVTFDRTESDSETTTITSAVVSGAWKDSGRHDVTGFCSASLVYAGSSGTFTPDGGGQAGETYVLIHSRSEMSETTDDYEYVLPVDGEWAVVDGGTSTATESSDESVIYRTEKDVSDGPLTGTSWTDDNSGSGSSSESIATSGAGAWSVIGTGKAYVWQGTGSGSSLSGNVTATIDGHLIPGGYFRWATDDLRTTATESFAWDPAGGDAGTGAWESTGTDVEGRRTGSGGWSFTGSTDDATLTTGETDSSVFTVTSDVDGNVLSGTGAATAAGGLEYASDAAWTDTVTYDPAFAGIQFEVTRAHHAAAADRFQYATTVNYELDAAADVWRAASGTDSSSGSGSRENGFTIDAELLGTSTILDASLTGQVSGSHAVGRSYEYSTAATLQGGQWNRTGTGWSEGYARGDFTSEETLILTEEYENTFVDFDLPGPVLTEGERLTTVNRGLTRTGSQSVRRDYELDGANWRLTRSAVTEDHAITGGTYDLSVTDDWVTSGTSTDGSSTLGPWKSFERIGRSEKTSDVTFNRRDYTSTVTEYGADGAPTGPAAVTSIHERSFGGTADLERTTDEEWFGYQANYENFQIVDYYRSGTKTTGLTAHDEFDYTLTAGVAAGSSSGSETGTWTDEWTEVRLTDGVVTDEGSTSGTTGTETYADPAFVPLWGNGPQFDPHHYVRYSFGLTYPLGPTWGPYDVGYSAAGYKLYSRGDAPPVGAGSWDAGAAGVQDIAIPQDPPPEPGPEPTTGPSWADIARQQVLPALAAQAQDLLLGPINDIGETYAEFNQRWADAEYMGAGQRAYTVVGGMLGNAVGVGLLEDAREGKSEDGRTMGGAERAGRGLLGAASVVGTAVGLRAGAAGVSRGLNGIRTSGTTAAGSTPCFVAATPVWSAASPGGGVFDAAADTDSADESDMLTLVLAVAAASVAVVGHRRLRPRGPARPSRRGRRPRAMDRRTDGILVPAQEGDDIIEGEDAMPEASETLRSSATTDETFDSRPGHAAAAIPEADFSDALWAAWGRTGIGAAAGPARILPLSRSVDPNERVVPAVRPRGRLRNMLAMAWLAGFLALAAGLAARAIDPDAFPSPTTPAVAAVTPAAPALFSRPVAEVRLGMRVIGENPDRTQVEPGLEPDGTWRHVRLTMTKADGHRLDLELLRPRAWLAANGFEPAANVELDLPELGAVGPASVLAVGPCPSIEPGEGHVVTGRFVHDIDGGLLNLTLEGDSGPTGVTENHPYWSIDRREFVPAGELELGERVDTLSGPTRVAQVEPRPAETVYNLEVHGQHVYRAGDAGALVHNNCVWTSPSILFGRQPKSEFRSNHYKRLRDSMKEKGWDGPPIEVARVDGRLLIIDGHHRARAAGAARLPLVPVIIKEVDEATASRYFEQAAEAAQSLGLESRFANPLPITFSFSP